MIEGIIYKYTSPSGRSYIGQPTNEKIRREHWNTEGPYAGRKIDRARKKYGIHSFTYEVLERRLYESKEEAKDGLDALEIYYIGLYDSYKNGYNCTIGGNTTLGYSHTDETKELLSKLAIGREVSELTKAKQSISRRGKIKSKEWREHISNSLKGRKLSTNTIQRISESKSKAVVQYDIDGTYINEYKSPTEASQKTRIGVHAIYKCLCGKNETSGGFIWKYKN